MSDNKFFPNLSEQLMEVDEILDSSSKPIPYGIPFLDDALNGIFRDDLILITAKTGGGKTEIATGIAYNAALSGRKVYYFALEAHRAEITARIKYRELARAFYRAGRHRRTEERPDYQDWIDGLQNHLLSEFTVKVDQKIHKEAKNFHVHYSDHEFDADKFEGLMNVIGEECDLVILDHIHHMDMKGGKEIDAFKKVVRQVKKTISFFRKPMLLVAQLRKGDRFDSRIMPTLDDVYGASELSKIVTRVIATAPANETEPAEKTLFPTYIRVLKNRKSGSRTICTAMCNFDFSKNEYAAGYTLGVLRKNESEFEEINQCSYPPWARNAIQTKILPSSQLDLEGTI